MDSNNKEKRIILHPTCLQIAHPSLATQIEPLLALKLDVEKKARMRLEYDGLMECAAITKPERYVHV